MLNTINAPSNYDFDTSLSILSLDDSYYSQNFALSCGYDNFINPFKIKDYQYIGKKKVREPFLDYEKIFQAVTKVFLDDSKEEKEKPKKFEFQIKKKKKRGQKRANAKERENTERIHSKNDFDNLISGIQVHFINFIINLSNDIIKSFTPPELEKDEDFLFKDIRHDIKKNINFENFEKLKTSSVKEILDNPVSRKFKLKNKNYESYNREIYDKAINKKDNKKECLKEFFDMNYMTLFSYYYNQKERLEHIIIEGNKINLTKKTRSFSELYNKSNDERKKLLIKDINRAYFGIIETNEKNNSKSNYFKTTKLNKEL